MYAATSPEQYIERRDDKFRVRFPQHLLQKRWYGTFDTMTDAQEARDRFLASLEITVSRMPLPALGAIDFADIPMTENTARFTEESLTIPNPNVLVFSDMHVPHQNRVMLRRAIYIAKRYFPHIQDVAVIGDTWDWASLSRHPKNAPAESMDDSLEKGADLYRILGQYFKDIWVTNGNHDERLALKLDSPFTLKRLFNSAFGSEWPKARMHISDFDYLYVDHKDSARRWMLGHPSHYNSRAGATASEIADLEGLNVATGHSHVIGFQQSKSAKFLGVDVGHMTDPNRHYYIQRRQTKFTRWNSGFLVISNGHPYPYSERFTDWKLLGCE